MGLWGASDAAEDKPKHFTTEQKEEIVANAHGWTVKAGSTLAGNDNTDADPEILVLFVDWMINLVSVILQDLIGIYQHLINLMVEHLVLLHTLTKQLQLQVHHN